jgi:predicted RNase H-like HicB family nuclease
MATLTKTRLEKRPEEDTVRIKNGTLTVEATIISGKDGEHFVSIVPSLMISGYGSTEQEAMDSLDENMETFCDDFMKLSLEQRKSELIKLGFSQVPYHTKNFSKLYVDENGLLQGLENVTIKKSKQYKVAC